MRRCYLVCYDIRDAKRLRRVHKICKGYGEPWQYSIFLCNLREIDWVRLQVDLECEMNLKEDQALIIPLGLDEAEVRERATIIGQSLPELPPHGGVVVI